MIYREQDGAADRCNSGTNSSCSTAMLNDAGYTSHATGTVDTGFAIYRATTVSYDLERSARNRPASAPGRPASTAVASNASTQRRTSTHQLPRAWNNAIPSLKPQQGRPHRHSRR